MPIKQLFISLLLIIASLEPLRAEPVELYAGSISNDDNFTIASGDTYLIRKDMTIKADVIRFDKRTKDLEAFGNIFLTQPGGSYLLSDYLFMDMNRSYSILDKFFYMTPKDEIWISSCEAVRNDDLFLVKKALVSSCNPHDPDWTIGFSSGEFDREDEWLRLYNPVVYAGRVPVFYLPYIGIPTSTKRRSGILKPKYGTSNTEGAIFKQPLYLAPQPWWDATLIPEARTKRGNGLWGEFRVADSPYSTGSIEAGAFYDHQSFVNEYELQNDKHSGYHLRYNRSRLAADPEQGSRDALYIDYTRLTDVDYLTLQEQTATTLSTSKLNYLYYTRKNYFGLNAKYFQDMTTSTNDQTLQVLPQFHYHSSTDSLIWNHLIYSADYKAKRYDRVTGLTANDQVVNIPVSYAFSLFGDYLGGLVSNTFYHYRIDYGNDDSVSDPTYQNYGQVNKNSLYATLYTDLSRGYENFFHTINFSASYTKVNGFEQKGYFDPEFVTVTEDTDKVALKFTQYFYSGMENSLSHRLTQTYSLGDDDNITASDIENEINLKLYGSFVFNSRISVYDETRELYKASHTLQYRKQKFAFSFNNIYERDPLTKAVTTDYYTYSGMIHPVYAHKLSANYSYDTVLHTTTGYGVEYLYNKKCWDLTVSYSREIKPYLSNDTVNSKINDIIYLKINLNPFWGFEQKAYENERDG